MGLSKSGGLEEQISVMKVAVMMMLCNSRMIRRDDGFHECGRNISDTARVRVKGVMEQEALQLHEQLTRYCETPTSAAAAVVELVRTSKDPANAVEILVDLIWLFDLQFTELGDEGARARERLHQLVQQLLLSNLAPEDLLKSRLELEFLEQVGLIDSAALWSKRAVRMNTTML